MQKRNGKNKKVYEKPITRYRITEDRKQALMDNVESDIEKPITWKLKPQVKMTCGFYNAIKGYWKTDRIDIVENFFINKKCKIVDKKSFNKLWKTQNRLHTIFVDNCETLFRETLPGFP